MKKSDFRFLFYHMNQFITLVLFKEGRFESYCIFWCHTIFILEIVLIYIENRIRAIVMTGTVKKQSNEWNDFECLNERLSTKKEEHWLGFFSTLTEIQWNILYRKVLYVACFWHNEIENHFPLRCSLLYLALKVWLNWFENGYAKTFSHAHRSRRDKVHILRNKYMWRRHDSPQSLR